MPYYDYKCEECGLVFELRKGMNENASPACPKCGSNSRRVFSAPRTMRSDSNSCGTCASGTCSSCGGS